jgi:ribose 1,5-bisphosphate isomerase
MDVVDRTVRDIKSLKIQGAYGVAVAAIKAWEKAKNKKLAIKKLGKSRPTEPMLRNCLHYLSKNPDAKKLLKKLENDEKKIIKFGAEKVGDGMTVYTHCHSSTVNKIIEETKRQGKNIRVNCTETRPFFQGRITAAELAKHKIPVTLFVDSAARLALKKVDLMLIGADAITAEGYVINKIGSELMVEVANRYQVPVYVCTHSWKFDPKTMFGFDEEIEKRSMKEVWKNPPKGVKISNFSFEKVDPKKITGIISEYGILEPAVFVEEVKKNYRWLFE